MAKKESTFLNMVLTLFVVTFISGVALSFIYQKTKEPIRLSKLNNKLKAIEQVVPEFDNNPSDEMYKVASVSGIDSLEFYPAKKDGKLVGIAVKTYSNAGFNGLIMLMVGLKADGSIHNISVLEHGETPGLGTKMTEPGFKDQFNSKNPAEYKMIVSKDGGDVDAITAATISSRAFCDAVQRAYDAFMKAGK